MDLPTEIFQQIQSATSPSDLKSMLLASPSFLSATTPLELKVRISAMSALSHPPPLSNKLEDLVPIFFSRLKSLKNTQGFISSLPNSTVSVPAYQRPVFSPGGNHLAILVDHGALHIYDYSSNAARITKVPAIAENSADPDFKMQFSPDGRHIEASDPWGKTVLVETDAPTRLLDLGQGEGEFSVDGKYYAFSGEEGSLKILDLKHGLVDPVFLDSVPSDAYALKFSPDGTFVVLARQNTTEISVHHLDKDLKPIHSIEANGNTSNFCVSHTNNRLAAYCNNEDTDSSTLKIWDISEPAKLIATLPSGDFDYHLNISGDGNFIIRQDPNEVGEVWSIGEKPTRLAESGSLDNFCRLSFSKDSRYLLRWAIEHQNITLCDLTTEPHLAIDIHDKALADNGLDSDVSACMAEDGRHALVQSSDYIRIYNLEGSEPKRIDVWISPEAQKVLGDRVGVGRNGLTQKNLDTNLSLLGEQKAAPVLSPDGFFLATTHSSGVRLWDLTLENFGS